MKEEEGKDGSDHRFSTSRPLKQAWESLGFDGLNYGSVLSWLLFSLVIPWGLSQISKGLWAHLSFRLLWSLGTLASEEFWQQLQLHSSFGN